MGRTNIKVEDGVFEQHNKQRKEMDLTWSQYMRRLEVSDGGGTGGVTETEAREIADEQITARVISEAQE